MAPWGLYGLKLNIPDSKIGKQDFKVILWLQDEPLPLRGDPLRLQRDLPLVLSEGNPKVHVLENSNSAKIHVQSSVILITSPVAEYRRHSRGGT